MTLITECTGCTKVITGTFKQTFTIEANGTMRHTATMICDNCATEIDVYTMLLAKETACNEQIS